MRTLGLLFSGQGAQKVGMGKSLCDRFPAAANLYQQANQILGWDLQAVCFEGPERELTQTRVCQPALFVHGMAIVAVLREKGLLEGARVALGLSLGEVTALTAGGVFDFATGLRVVAERGRLMQEACETTTGGMASIIGVGREEVAALCREFDIDMANLNSPGQIVISGDKARVDAAVEAARARGYKRIIPLNVAGAYHSRLMQPARQEFDAFLGQIPFHPPQLTIFTNTTGQPVREARDIREALVKQVVSPVLWEDCMRNAAGEEVDTFIECGPGGVLAGLARRIDPAIKVAGISEAEDIEKVAISGF